MTPMLSVAVLAGGKSTRMETDKALVELAGVPLIARVIERVRPLEPAEIVIICRQPARYAFLDLPAYDDLIPDLGPMGGLLTALTHARHPHVIVVGCDMPFVNPALLTALVEAQRASGDVYDAVVPWWQGQAQPLHALYHVKCLDQVAGVIASGERRMRRLLEMLHVRAVAEPEIEPLDPEGRAFINLNTPGDLRDAQPYPQTSDDRIDRKGR